MVKKFYFVLLNLIILSCFGYLFYSCDSGIEPSPNPGIVRITIQSDPADTSIVIVPDTLSVSPKDSFGVEIFQGRAFDDSISAILYTTPRTTRQQKTLYNMIKIENGKYKQYTIFESHVPPESYNRIQFGIESKVIKFRGFDEIKVVTLDEAKFVDLYQDFSITENSVTEISVQISPFKSVTRYRDTYQFKPQVKIIDVKYFK